MSKYHFIAALFLITVSSNLLLSANPNASSLLDSAIKCEKEGKTTDAQKLFNEIAAKYPSSAEGKRANVRISRVEVLDMINSGNYDAASQKIAGTVAKYDDCDQDVRWLLYGAAEAYNKAGKRDDAISAYDKVIAINSTSGLGKSAIVKRACLKALSFVEEGKFDKADNEIDNVVRNYPGHKDLKWCLFNVGSKYGELKEKAQARKYYDLCVKQFGDDVFGIKAKIKCTSMDAIDAINAGNIDTASQLDAVIAQGMEKAPTDVKWYLHNVGCALDEKGAVAEADRFYGKFLELFSSDVLAEGVKLRRERIAMLNDIDKGEIASIVSDVDSLISAYSPNEMLPWCVYSCACRLDEKGYTKEAVQLYKRFIEAFPKNDFATGARVKSERIDIVNLIKDADSFEQSCVKFDQFKQNFGKHNDFADAAFCVAEAYYETGMTIQNTQKPYFEKSVTIIENDVIPNYANKATKASALYELGLNRDAMGEYKKAAEAFTKAIDIYPQHRYADYCIFASVRCYEKLLEQKAISEGEAKTVIKSQYDLLLKNYPQSSYLSLANEWLANNK